jgi:hypothetical protein
MKLDTHRTTILPLAAVLVLGASCPATMGASPSAEQALRLIPTQSGVDYDRPTPTEASTCKVVARRIDGGVGWVGMMAKIAGMESAAKIMSEDSITKSTRNSGVAQSLPSLRVRTGFSRTGW